MHKWHSEKFVSVDSANILIKYRFEMHTNTRHSRQQYGYKSVSAEHNDVWNFERRHAWNTKRNCKDVYTVVVENGVWFRDMTCMKYKENTKDNSEVLLNVVDLEHKHKL